MNFAHRLSALFLPIIAGLLLVSSAGSAQAKDAAPAPSNPATAPATLPEPLTPEAIRELISRLSDTEVRKLLINQLDRAAVKTEADGDMTDMVGAMDKGSSRLRERAERVLRAGGRLPEGIGHVVGRLTDARGPIHLLEIMLGLAVMLLVGWMVESAYRRVLHAPLARVGAGLGASFGAETGRFVLKVALEAIAIALFYAGAIGLFFAFYQGHQATRIIVHTVLVAIVIVRAVVIASRILLAPRAPTLRLLPFDDAAAQRLHASVIWLSVLWVGTLAIYATFAVLGVDPQVIEFLQLGLGTVVLLSFVTAVWRIRAPIARLIRGSDGGALRRILGDLWAVIATLYLGAVYAARIGDLLMGTTGQSNAAIESILLVVALPIADMVLCRALSAAIDPSEGEDARPSILASYESVLRQAIHIVVTVVGFLMLADIWQLDLFGFAQRSLGGRITSALLGIAVVLLLAYITWEIVNTAIERRMRAETPQDAVTPASRLRTLLPLFRMVLLATIFVMATLSVLSALGVNIVPLLAGASVVGVAIGFGSQTLVRDIVTGAFFLIDDAFRLGEYIEVGNTKGRIEKITARALFLRHHRGQLNVLPYGEIRQLKNNSRDWIIMKLEFRVTYDTDLTLVKKIMKKIGAELSADPELGKDLLEPLKSQGVYSTEDSALVIRAKFMAKPGPTVYMIRRVAFDKVLKAFKENNIKFAHRQVTVLVPSSEDEALAAKAAAGAAAFIAEPPKPGTT
jgi:small-conductance mechanosensitive channel